MRNSNFLENRVEPIHSLQTDYKVHAQIVSKVACILTEFFTNRDSFNLIGINNPRDQILSRLLVETSHVVGDLPGEKHHQALLMHKVKSCFVSIAGSVITGSLDTELSQKVLEVLNKAKQDSDILSSKKLYSEFPRDIPIKIPEGVTIPTVYELAFLLHNLTYKSKERLISSGKGIISISKNNHNYYDVKDIGNFGAKRIKDLENMLYEVDKCPNKSRIFTLWFENTNYKIVLRLLAKYFRAINSNIAIELRRRGETEDSHHFVTELYLTRQSDKAKYIISSELDLNRGPNFIGISKITIRRLSEEIPTLVVQ